MPTSEYGSAACTFSMSRLAIRLPMVARRSPAITTPSAQEMATMVVPCGAMSALIPGGRGRRPGSSSGAATERNSVNDDMPAVVYTAGRRPDDSKPADTEPLSTHGTRCSRNLSERDGTGWHRSCAPIRLLAALLDVPTDELLGVLLQ